MSGDGTALEPWVGGGPRTTLTHGGDSGPGQDGVDLVKAVRWLERHRVVVAGGLLIAGSLLMKAQFLRGLYLRQDDFHLLDRAFANP